MFCLQIKGRKKLWKCALKDDLTPILEKLEDADAVIIGSPIYFMSHSGEMRSFMERFFFPYLEYSPNHPSLYPKKIPLGYILTMNVPEEQFEFFGMNKFIEINEMFATNVFGYSETLCSTETYQFDDYSRYVSSMFDPEAKAKRREEVFPQDCEKAFEMGASFVKRQKYQ